MATSDGTIEIDDTKPWEVRDQRIRERYEIVAEALEHALDEIGAEHIDKSEIGHQQDLEYDPDTIAGTEFEPLLNQLLTTDSGSAAAGYDAVKWEDNHRLKQVRAPEKTDVTTFFGNHYNDVDVSICCIADDDSAEEIAGRIVYELQVWASGTRTAAEGGAINPSINYYHRTEFWPSAHDTDPAELREHLLKLHADGGPIETDDELRRYLRDLRRWHRRTSWGHVDDELLEPKEVYLDRRCKDADISPLSSELVAELLCDQDGLELVSTDTFGDRIAVEPTDSDAPNTVTWPLSRYGYEQSNIKKPESEDAWVRIIYQPSRDHREILGRLIAADVDIETAIHYWGSKVFNAQRGSTESTQKTEWMNASGVGYNTSQSAIQEIEEQVPSAYYLTSLNERPAPDSLSSIE